MRAKTLQSSHSGRTPFPRVCTERERREKAARTFSGTLFPLHLWHDRIKEAEGRYTTLLDPSPQMNTKHEHLGPHLLPPRSPSRRLGLDIRKRIWGRLGPATRTTDQVTASTNPMTSTISSFGPPGVHCLRFPVSQHFPPLALLRVAQNLNHAN